MPFPVERSEAEITFSSSQKKMTAMDSSSGNNYVQCVAYRQILDPFALKASTYSSIIAPEVHSCMKYLYISTYRSLNNTKTDGIQRTGEVMPKR
jgi:hypothetical protein